MAIESNTFYTLWQLPDTGPKPTIRFLMYLRLLVVSLALIAIVCWEYIMQTFDHGESFALLFITVFVWTLLVLAKPSLQTKGHAEAREISVDLLWTSTAVVLAGGTSNPFIYYFLVLIALAAMLLSRPQAWSVCIISILIYSLLLARDVSVHFQHMDAGFRLHLIGMWLNYLISALIICFFVSSLVGALRKQNLHIQHIREKNMKNEQLIGLATVSASAVHNLATPLSTLRMLIDEFNPQRIDTHELNDDLSLMKQQISRCQHTIEQLSVLAQKNDEIEWRSSLTLIEEIGKHYALNSPENIPIITNNISTPVLIETNDLFDYAVINLINNAMEAAINKVAIQFNSLDEMLIITIENLCDKVNKVILEKWGKPLQSQKTLGLGIGSFLANSTIERLNGTVEMKIHDAAKPDKSIHVCVTIKIPCKLFDKKMEV